MESIALFIGYLIIYLTAAFGAYRICHGLWHSTGYCVFMVRGILSQDDKVFWPGLLIGFLRKFIEYTIMGAPLAIRKRYGIWQGGFTFTISDKKAEL